MMSIEKIGFIGLGLIGGSLAKAIFEKTNCSYIVAYDKNRQSLLEAKGDGIIKDYSFEIDSIFADCDLIFLCAPIEVNIMAIDKLKPIIKKDCILTDVGSTKESIMAYVNKMDETLYFIGGHPMTGSEKAGFGASNSHLFENAYYLLTPIKTLPENIVHLLYNIVHEIGAIPLILDYSQHDYITAVISHVPHVIASTLVNLVQDLDTEDGYMHQLAAGGFKDLTRIASSSPTIWQHICSSNREEIVKVMDAFIHKLNKVKNEIQIDDKTKIYDFFAESKNYRNSFSDKSFGPIIKSYTITVDVIDKPGIIAEIATILSQHGINIKNIGIINNREMDQGVLEIVFYNENSQLESIKLLKDMDYIVYKR